MWISQWCWMQNAHWFNQSNHYTNYNFTSTINLCNNLYDGFLLAKSFSISQNVIKVLFRYCICGTAPCWNRNNNHKNDIQPTVLGLFWGYEIHLSKYFFSKWTILSDICSLMVKSLSKQCINGICAGGFSDNEHLCIDSWGKDIPFTQICQQIDVSQLYSLQNRNLKHLKLNDWIENIPERFNLISHQL